MNILMHMPHVSLKVPKKFYKGLKIPKDLFNKYNLEMTDLGIDILFKDYKYKKISPKYSRLYCDAERFRDDSMEVMSKYGEGVVYTHLYDGVEYHEHDNKYKRQVLKYYDKYHKKLDRIAKKLLKNDDVLLILDCHSFSDKMASHFYDSPFPDICIGIEENYYDKEILDLIINRIKNLGYSYKINYPYRGSLVPNCIFNGKIKGKVVSIMLEINKRIYL
jgi:N-formylglutamate amidohydrolase